MKVYMAQRGERYEGSRILGIYASKRSAIKRALQEPAHFDDKHWKLTTERTWLGCVASWENGCDDISVTEWEVEP